MYTRRKMPRACLPAPQVNRQLIPRLRSPRTVSDGGCEVNADFVERVPPVTGRASVSADLVR